MTTEPEASESSDRYGGNYPDPDTVCPGPCEGMGVYPVEDPDSADGWIFAVCEDCDGTGLRRD